MVFKRGFSDKARHKKQTHNITLDMESTTMLKRLKKTLEKNHPYPEQESKSNELKPIIKFAQLLLKLATKVVALLKLIRFLLKLLK